MSTKSRKISFLKSLWFRSLQRYVKSFTPRKLNLKFIVYVWLSGNIMIQKENKAVLVAIGNTQHAEITQEHLDELAFLAETAGIKTIRKFVQNLPHPDSRTFVGKGKLTEIKEFVLADKITHVIFDDDL